MKRMNWLWTSFLIVVTMLLIPVWSAQSAEQAGAKYGGIKELKILDGASSSATFVPYSARAQILSSIPGIRVTCIAGSITGNLDALEKGQGDISHSTNANMRNAATGKAPFEGKTYKNLAFLGIDEGPRPSVIFVRADSKIYTMQDLKGKHIGTSTRGSGTAVMWTKMLAYHGITPENITQSGGRISYLAPGDVIQGMRDKTIDVCLNSSGYYDANPGHLELIKTIGVRLIPLDPKAIEQYLKDDPAAMKTHVKAGLYNNKEPYDTWASETQTIVVRRDLPDDLVYDILKTLYSKQGRKALYDAYPTAIPFVLENGLQGSVKEMPIHPGAVKFYKDNGVVADKPFIWPASKEEALNKYGGKW